MAMRKFEQFIEDHRGPIFVGSDLNALKAELRPLILQMQQWA